ncbi:MAG: 23S rRNA (adenine(2503)-C(2))-methyltransferase RlmN [Saprospiraceae bacterium]|nr:23S rRNA (adenine(2503)-C(2))-methyltransferase RlmN [Saprospiraceae bacterium]
MEIIDKQIIDLPATAKVDIRKLDFSEIEEWIVNMKLPKFRAKQIYSWLWEKSATNFDLMTNLSFELRDELQKHFEILPIQVDKYQKSSDGTIKTRFILHDGNKIESVLIPVPDDIRYTVCVSTQVGCSLSCKFCATGLMKRVRNLSAAEIVDQVVLVNKQCREHFGHPLTNIVYMGMGEPLLNYQATLKSIEHITSPSGLGMSPKRITISTAGISKMIKKLADDGVKCNLALSLHAADDMKRNEIMPINENNNLEALMEALQYFYRHTKNRISFEYVALHGVNLSMSDAKNLAKHCRKFPVKVNIIEYNTVEGLPFGRAAMEETDAFGLALRNLDVTVTIRRSRGKDIDAACGQLANKE